MRSVIKGKFKFVPLNQQLILETKRQPERTNLSISQQLENNMIEGLLDHNCLYVNQDTKTEFPCDIRVKFHA